MQSQPCSLSCFGVPSGRINELGGLSRCKAWKKNTKKLFGVDFSTADSFAPISFPQVASSVGAPSLVALAKGFHVWSSDLRDESAWQRWAGARASSFTEAQLKRFRTPRLDLLDERRVGKRGRSEPCGG